MFRRFPGTIVFVLTLALFLRTIDIQRADERDDPEVSAGIELIRSGDMEGAVHALSKAARALEVAADRSAELTRAYVYLGVAYLELGQTQLAQAKFLDALSLTPQLQLDPSEFSRKVIREFDIARSRPRVPRPPVRPPATTSPTPKTKGGFPTVPVVLGIGGAATAGVVLASGSGSPPATTRPSVPTATIDVSYSGGAVTGVTVITFMASAERLSSPSFVWNFGDGTTGSGTSVDHRFDAEGTFTVTLTATGIEGTATAMYTVASRTLTGRWSTRTFPCGDCWVNDLVQQGSTLSGSWTIYASEGFFLGTLVNGRVTSPNHVTFTQDRQCRRVFQGAVASDLNTMLGPVTPLNSDCGTETGGEQFRRQ